MEATEVLAADSPPSQHVDRSVHVINYVTQSLCLVFMTIFFFLRVYARLRVLNGFAVEDWFCLGAYILGMCYSVISLIMGHFGGGLHIQDVPPANVIPFNKTVYVTMVMYGPTAFLTKISILWIMTRVFAPYKKAIRFIYILLGIMLAYYIPAIIVKTRICTPISRFWMGPSVGGSCLNEGSIILADAVISVISDLTILVLPLPLTLSLQMAMRKKLRVMGILGAGGLAVASSIVRLAFIVRYGNSSDSTYDFMRINMFGNAEISIGIICACLPALSALIFSYVREYSDNKATSSSQHYELSRASKMMKSQGRMDTTKGSRHRMSITEVGSDQDILISHAQGEPGVETSIQGDADQGSQRHRRGSFDGIGIMKTVDVSTTYSERK
ncbi:hypothetical protein VTN77DRAFT_927 [Rasamsonia byssochlamydoides]|uniref:uncharacterized protein n=1 Tax=Rasamsonia byssochlamydoides TaxID=89139 RepID=UPI0037434B7E